VRGSIYAFSYNDAENPISVTKYTNPDLPSQLKIKNLQPLDPNYRFQFFSIANQADMRICLSGGCKKDGTYVKKAHFINLQTGRW